VRRIFVLKASTAVTAPIFILRNIAGTSGRLDIVCRCIINAFLINGRIRRNVDFYAVLEGPPSPPRLLMVSSELLSHLPKSEVEVARIIRDLLSIGKGFHPRNEAFKIDRMSFKKLILYLKNEGYSLVYLHENGVDIRKFNFASLTSTVFILGDHLGLDPASEKFLDSLNIPRISLGPISYLASHCIILVNEELDRLKV